MAYIFLQIVYDSSVCVCVWLRLIYSLGWPQTFHVTQVDLKFVILLPLPSKCWITWGIMSDYSVAGMTGLCVVYACVHVGAHHFSDRLTSEPQQAPEILWYPPTPALGIHICLAFHLGPGVLHSRHSVNHLPSPVHHALESLSCVGTQYMHIVSPCRWLRGLFFPWTEIVGGQETPQKLVSCSELFDCFFSC